MTGVLWNVSARLKDLLLREAGQDLVEYGLLALLASLGILAAYPPLANAVTHILTAVSADL